MSDTASYGGQFFSRLACVAAIAALAAGLAAAPGAAQGAGTAWTSVGPVGGAALSLAVDPADPHTAYAVAGVGGLFKTVNAGLSWAHSDAGLVPGVVRRVVVDPAAPATVYAVVNFLIIGDMGAGGGIFKSTDGGVTWNSAGSGLPSPFLDNPNDLAIDPQSHGTLYAAVGNRVFKSVDGAASWADSGAGLRPGAVVLTVTVDPVQPANVFAGTTVGVFRSLDGGASWSPAQQGMGRPPVVALAVDPQAHQTVYAAAQPVNPASPQGLFVSTDGGATWQARPLATSNPAAACVTVSPAADRAVFACGVGAGLFKSVDQGQHWSAVFQGQTTSTFAALAVAPSAPNTLYAGVAASSNVGPPVYRSLTAGATWKPYSTGYAAAALSALAVDPATAGTLYAGSPTSGVQKTTDDGATWTAANNGLDSTTAVTALTVSPVAPATLFVDTDGGFFISQTRATHWRRPGAPFAGIPPLVPDPRTPATVYSGGPAGQYKSLDSGATWSLILQGAVEYDPLFAVAPSAPSTLYAVTLDVGAPAYVDTLYSSQNAGTSFQSALSAPAQMLLLVVDPTAPKTVYFNLAYTSYTQPGLFKSTDGGHTAALLLAGQQTVLTLAVDPANPQTLYAGTTNDVLVSHDGGATWAELAPGLPPVPVQQLFVGPGNAVYAQVTGNGVYRVGV
jgi:photosystem II stability/assembly factor-like uncharacterized protein